MKVKRKVMLMVLDGLGAAPKNEGNAVVLANPTELSNLWISNPRTYLMASGEAVGLPKGVKGNSEVGHQNLGSGRTVYQNLLKVDRYIQTGNFFKSQTLMNTLKHAKVHNSNIHVVGLLSDGSVHSHISHILSLVKFFAQNNFDGNLYIHAFTDGRDTPTNVSKIYLKRLVEYCNTVGIGKLATISGRKYGMDRNRSWDRTKKAYDLIFKGVGEKYSSYEQAIDSNYAKNITDEFIEPCVIDTQPIKENDVIIHMNFRSDRALQLSRAITDPSFGEFETVKIPNLLFTSLVEYRKDFPINTIVPKQYINLPLGRILSNAGLIQLRIAESEKFPHVTYFFNGGLPIRYDNEDRIEIPSPKVPVYDQKPEMSAYEMTDILINRIEADMYDFILVNFANPDMVAHTGNLEASIKAVQTVDKCVKGLVNSFTSKGGVVIITADHGNAEELINLDTNEIDTEHSLNPVPFILIGSDIGQHMLPYGSLRDVAPTILDLVGIEKPIEMTGKSLLPSL